MYTAHVIVRTCTLHVCVVCILFIITPCIADEVNEAGQTTKSTNCQAIVSININGEVEGSYCCYNYYCIECFILHSTGMG